VIGHSRSVGVTVAAVLAATAVALGACGDETASVPDPEPATATVYSELPEAQRIAAAEGCRDRATARAEGLAAEQIGRSTRSCWPAGSTSRSR